MNDLLGKRATFVPLVLTNANGGLTGKGDVSTVTGVVVYVNETHKYFTIAYQFYGETFRESFKFSQIGKEVTIRG